jgi:hypothetical protein
MLQIGSLLGLVCTFCMCRFNRVREVRFLLQGSHRNSSVAPLPANRPGGRTRHTMWVTFCFLHSHFHFLHFRFIIFIFIGHFTLRFCVFFLFLFCFSDLITFVCFSFFHFFSLKRLEEGKKKSRSGPQVPALLRFSTSGFSRSSLFLYGKSW